MDYHVRKACKDDLERAQEIYAYARAFMRDHGNPNQWYNNHPPLEQLEKDVENGDLYVEKIRLIVKLREAVGGAIPCMERFIESRAMAQVGFLKLQLLLQNGAFLTFESIHMKIIM